LIGKSKIYFASDFHLGAPDYESSLIREKKIVQWLEFIEKDAAELYLLGDLFDFWFEYRHTVPKGYVRLLGKLASMSDKGMPIHIFTGNHDLWMRDYLTKELHADIQNHPQVRMMNGKRFYIAHGDGLGPGDRGFKLMKRVFTNKSAQWLFARIHPNAGISMANYFSRKSRAQTGEGDYRFYGEEKEWLIIHSKELLQKEHFDYFIYGHRHYPLMVDLGHESKYVNLGDWIKYFSYAVWDGEKLELKYFES
jgi:UDP-2,3-diacylglucosamine hydrolase